MAALGALTLVACPSAPDELGYFVIRDTANPVTERSFLVGDSLTTSGDPAILGHWSGDMGAVRYLLGPEHQAYLFAGDLASATSIGPPRGVAITNDAAFLHLPLLASTETEHLVDITPFDSSKWTSFRIYDQGMCSAIAPWDAAHPATPTVSPFANLVVGAFDGALSGNADCNQRFFRVQPAVLAALIHGAPSRGGVDPTDDRIVFYSVYRAQSVGICSPVHLGLRVEFGFRAVPGTFVSAPQCAAPNPTPVPGTTDFEGVIYDVQALVFGDCTSSPGIEGAVRDQLNALLPGLVRGAVRGAILRNPSEFGVPPDPVPCRCPEDCDARASRGSAWPWGTRHSCVQGQCFIQLEPRRLNVRPEGFEVVLVDEPGDPFRSLFAVAPAPVRSALCGAIRDRFTTVPTGPRPRPGTLPFPITFTSGVTADSNQCN